MPMHMPARTNRQFIHGPVRERGRDERGCKVHTHGYQRRRASARIGRSPVFPAKWSSRRANGALQIIPVLPKILSPVRGHVHHRRAASLFVSSGKFFVEMAQAVITMWPGMRFHKCSSVPLRNLGRNSKCFGQLGVLQPTTTAGYAAEHDGPG